MGISGTKEWATEDFAIQRGCENGCSYCWAKANALRFKQIKTPEEWLKPVINEAKVNKKWRKHEGRVFFPSTHDITPLNIRECIITLIHILGAGNEVLIVSKPRLGVIKHLCFALQDYNAQILFRFTIGSNSDSVLKFWEPFAPSYLERKDSLKYAFEKGFETSVSSEPYLDENIGEVIEDLKPFVSDALWLGKMNRIKERVDTTGWDPAQFAHLDRVRRCQTDAAIHTLYEHFKNDPKVKFKDSIKKVVGLPELKKIGEDV